MGSCLTLGNELSEEAHSLTKQRTYEKGCPGREQQSEGTQENCSATWLAGQKSWVLWSCGSFLGCLWPVILLVSVFGPIPGGSCIS